MILDTYRLEHRDKHGKIQWFHKLQCDIETCNAQWDESRKNTIRKKKGRKGRKTLADGVDRCPSCLQEKANRDLVDAGTKALASITAEDRSINGRLAGIASQSTGIPKATWFSTSRWNALTPEQQQEQVVRANKASLAKIDAMSDAEKALHYERVMRGGIGYESKGQIELTEALKPYGYEGNYRISNMLVDICNPTTKVVVEYNGDAYHCNPATWSKDQYSSLIKMTAGKKWSKDIARYRRLESMGYTVIVVWESDWKTDPLAQLRRIT